MGGKKDNIFGADIHASQVIGFLIVLLIVGGTLNWLYSQWMAMEADLRLALTMIFFVWVLNWARKNLGSPRLAIVYAIVLAYIIFFKHPSVVWWIFGILILLTFGAKFWDKIQPGSSEKSKILNTLKEMKPNVIVYQPYPATGPAYPYQQQREGGNRW